MKFQGHQCDISWPPIPMEGLTGTSNSLVKEAGLQDGELKEVAATPHCGSRVRCLRLRSTRVLDEA
ncbi:hypothetical protein T265_02490 [Opisthorchis viverrini]|uniref:Uncharacterized protein n=1 Tax=Opisthorchis viverrini TaxID=6198 RepID=A0A075AIA8_OPIVI|nr:hypothetical protein T265_02490 [Opisthorchis viverrini]KER31309.1 hypothetical protein T265_02490 [Opisthorchis viverrini]